LLVWIEESRERRGKISSRKRKGTLIKEEESLGAGRVKKVNFK